MAVQLSQVEGTKVEMSVSPPTIPTNPVQCFPELSLLHGLKISNGADAFSLAWCAAKIFQSLRPAQFANAGQTSTRSTRDQGEQLTPKLLGVHRNDNLPICRLVGFYGLAFVWKSVSRIGDQSAIHGQRVTNRFQESRLIYQFWIIKITWILPCFHSLIPCHFSPGSYHSQNRFPRQNLLPSPGRYGLAWLLGHIHV